MEVEQLEKGNELLKKIDDNMAKIANLSRNIELEESGRPRFRKFLDMFRSSDQREKKYDDREKVWYWTFYTEPIKRVELEVEDLKAMVEGYKKRITELEKEFEEL